MEDDHDRLLLRPPSTPSHSRDSWAKEQTKLAIAHHVTMRLADDGCIARAPGALRMGSRIVQRIGRARGYLAHAFVDTHLHALLGGSREEAGMFARCVEGVLRKQLRIPVPFERCRIRPINDPRHFRNAVPYVFTQASRHNAAFDEAHDGSSLADLLGLRLGAEWIASRLLGVLPRLSREDMLRWLGAPELDAVVPDAAHVRDAAAAAWGVASLRGTDVEHVRARRAAVHLLDQLSRGCDVATVLDLSPRSVMRYQSQDVEPASLLAVELQVKLRTLLARRGEVAELGLAVPRDLQR